MAHFWMEHSAVSLERSAKTLLSMSFAESCMPTHRLVGGLTADNRTFPPKIEDFWREIHRTKFQLVADLIVNFNPLFV
jgi:hypothetical protein